MTQEEKDLVLHDLCGRLPYGVIVSPVDCSKAILIGIKDGNLLLWDTIHKKEYDKPWDIEYVKPYLRLMSSMTEEESAELSNIINEWFDKELFDLIEEPFLEFALQKINYSINPRLFDWLNKKMFDYRGLIPKGLALSTDEYNLYKN